MIIPKTSIKKFINAGIVYRYRLKELNIQHERLNKLSEFEFNEFIKSLNDCINLEVLNCWYCGIGLLKDRLKQFLETISFLNNLKIIYLPRNEFTSLSDENWEIFAKTFKENFHLLEIHFAVNQLDTFTDYQINAFKDLISNTKSLIKLNLAGNDLNNLSNSKLQALGKAIKYHPNLKEIEFEAPLYPEDISRINKEILIGPIDLNKQKYGAIYWSLFNLINKYDLANKNLISIKEASIDSENEKKDIADPLEQENNDYCKVIGYIQHLPNEVKNLIFSKVAKAKTISEEFVEHYTEKFEPKFLRLSKA